MNRSTEQQTPADQAPGFGRMALLALAAGLAAALACVAVTALTGWRLDPAVVGGVSGGVGGGVIAARLGRRQQACDDVGDDGADQA